MEVASPSHLGLDTSDPDDFGVLYAVRDEEPCGAQNERAVPEGKWQRDLRLTIRVKVGQESVDGSHHLPAPSWRQGTEEVPDRVLDYDV